MAAVAAGRGVPAAATPTHHSSIDGLARSSVGTPARHAPTPGPVPGPVPDPGHGRGTSTAGETKTSTPAPLHLLSPLHHASPRTSECPDHALFVPIVLPQSPCPAPPHPTRPASCMFFTTCIVLPRAALFNRMCSCFFPVEFNLFIISFIIYAKVCGSVCVLAGLRKKQDYVRNDAWNSTKILLKVCSWLATSD